MITPGTRLIALALAAVACCGAAIPQSKVWRQRSPAVAFNVGINPANPNSYYCERTPGSLYVTRDRGKHWSPLPASPPLSGIRHILVHPNDTMTVFAVAFSGGLYKTTNEGASWYPVIADYGIDGESMDYDPVRPDTMFAGNYGDGSVFRSSDRGETWTLRGVSGSHLCALTVRPDSTDILFAGTGSSTLSKSTDGGATWAVKLNGGTDEVPKIVVNPANPLVAYATTYGPDAQDNFWKTTDGGENWFLTALQGVGNWSVAIDVQHPETLYVGRFGATTGIDRTTDGGASFEHFESGLLPNFAAWNLRVHPLDPGQVWVAGTQFAFGPGGIFQFVDSSTTTLEGVIRDSLTDSPISAFVELVEPGDSANVAGNYSFKYYDGDPTLTPTLHARSTGYYPRNVTVAFVEGTTAVQDVRLLPVPFNSISGQVFNDLDGDGVKDPLEPGLSGWLVRLSGTESDSMVTGPEGLYAFDSLASGAYTVEEELQGGWVNLLPGCPVSYTLSFSEGTNVENVDFGNEVLAPGASLLVEGFESTTFPPPCWSIEDVNGEFTWHRVLTVFHTGVAAARCGVGNTAVGPSDDWLFSPPVRLEAGRVYRLGWWDRSFVSFTEICSLAVGIGLEPSAAGMTRILNDRAFDNNGEYEYVRQDFTVSADSEYTIGFHDYSGTGNTLRIDDVSLVYLQAGTASISGTVFDDADADHLKGGLEAGLPGWKVRLSGTSDDSAFSDGAGNYSFTGLAAGSYTVSEELMDGWTQTAPIAGTYDILLGEGETAAGQDFGNTLLSDLTLSHAEDADGDFSTGGDRTPRIWHLEIRKDSLNGTPVASGDGASVGAPGMLPGTYYFVEADSEAWTHIGYEVDLDNAGFTPTPGAANSTAVAVSGGAPAQVRFSSAPPAYAREYRTARPEEWAAATDAKGKLKPVKKKADKVEFGFAVVAPGTASAEVKLSMEATGAVTRGTSKTDTILTFASAKSVLVPVTAFGETVQVDGIGSKGKPVKAKVDWATAPRHTKVAVTVFKINLPRLPMPNLHNVGLELFDQGMFPAGLLEGVPQGAKGARSVLHRSYSDVLKSFNKKGLMHTHAAACLASFDNTKPLTRQLRSLPPDKMNNKLFAEVLALKLNIAASAANKFPVGLGELTFRDTAQVPNPFTGQTVSAIAGKADSMLACLKPASKDTAAATLDVLYGVVRAINSAFSGIVDTGGFAVKTQLTGVRRLIDVPYLHATPGLAPAAVQASAGQAIPPPEFRLHQNYPNPFNPSTTIAFELPGTALVTLKVYNMLGQEVADILDREEMDGGPQEAEFDARQLASGIYFYRLTAVEAEPDEGVSPRTRVQVRSMLLVK